ncbi:hypothetical protein Q5752_006264 [Cryptotrichosporon argae]
MLRHLLVGLLAARAARALGEPQVLDFPVADEDHAGQALFAAPRSSAVLVASSPASYALPLLLSSNEDPAVHIAAATFARDVYKVTGVHPHIFNDTLPADVKKAWVVGTVASDVIAQVGGSVKDDLKRKWESYDVRVVDRPLKGLDEGIVVTGSDRRGTVYALYTLSEQMGVSPWYYWSDVPITKHEIVAFRKGATLAHGEPTVKFRGLFINDEHPAMWGWAQKTFHRELWEPAFQADFYEHWFELLLRLKANYHWPAMYISAFRTDGLDVSRGLPAKPTAGPNLVLADRMGIISGSSHHEPMERNKPEWDWFGQGDWDWTNREFLEKFWTYGAQRAKDKDVLYTVGMRGDGDMPLTGASIELVENITAVQLDILRETYGDKYDDVPKMWAMYKEVAEYFVDGLKIPDDVTVLFADDNFGNIMSVLPPEREHKGGAGIYYHIDYVGYPRAYKWINTINLAKTWQQMDIARAFKTDEIWIVNVGSLKPLEMPAEHFLTLAYDFEQWGGPETAVERFLHSWASRDYGADVAGEVADIMGRYSIYASRRKPELINSTMWSLINYEEADRILEDWEALTARAKKVYDALPQQTRPAFYQNVYMLCQMQTNINKLYIEVGKSNHFAYQARTAANTHARLALEAFENDWNLTATFHTLLDGKWEHMLDQTHINWETHLEPDGDALPPVSYVNPNQPVRVGIPVPERTIPHEVSTRVSVENSYGAWPGLTLWNCNGEGKCPDPTLWRMDPYGAPTRWINIGAGGPREVKWEIKTDQSWLSVSRAHGRLKRDASADARVYVSVDWASVPDGFDELAHVDVKAQDGANVTVSIPVYKPAGPPEGWHGIVEGDQYVVADAADFSSRRDTAEHALREVKGYGRHRSGLAQFPVDTANYTAGAGPSVSYDFWTHGLVDAAHAPDVTITLQIGPTLNYVLGKQLGLAVQLDDLDVAKIHPIPTERLGPQYEKPGAPGLYIGAVPNDWPEIVRNDVRNVTLGVPAAHFAEPGEHTLTVYGMTAGLVLERIWVDLGGIQARGYSYLGPPASVRV